MTVEEIVRYHKDFLFAKAYRLCSQKSIAEEYVSTCIARMWEHKETIENHENWKGYITLIINRLHIDRHRLYTSRYVSVPEIFDCEESKFYFNQEGRKEVELLEFLELVTKDLTENQKSAFMLQAQGYKYTEIAEKLNENIGSIKTRIFHARKKLKKNKLLLEHLKNN